MKKYRLEKLTAEEKTFAEENHNLIYSYLFNHGYSIEEYYSIAVFGYLKSVQIYHRREDIRARFGFPYVAFQYMRTELANHFKRENARKRKPAEPVLSLDGMDGMENFISGWNRNIPESEFFVMEIFSELMENLTQLQRKITELKIYGYENREVCMVLGIRPSTYYKELNRIKTAFERLVG